MVSSILATTGRGREIPISQSRLPDEVKTEIQEVKTPDQLIAFLERVANDRIADKSSITRSLVLGGIHYHAEQLKLLPDGRSAKTQEEKDAVRLAVDAMEKRTGVKMGTMRLGRRLWNEQNFIDDGLDFFAKYKDRLSRRPRNTEGPEYALSAIKAFKQFRLSLAQMKDDGKLKTEAEALADANETLPKDLVIRHPTITARQIAQRKDAWMIALMVAIETRDNELSEGIRAAIKTLDTPRKLFTALDSRAYSQTEQDIFRTLLASVEKPFDDSLDAARRLLQEQNVVATTDTEDEEPTESDEPSLRVIEGDPIQFPGLSGHNRTRNAAQNAAVKEAHTVGWTGSGSELIAQSIIIIEETESEGKPLFVWKVKPPEGWKPEVIHTGGDDEAKATEEQPPAIEDQLDNKS